MADESAAGQATPDPGATSDPGTTAPAPTSAAGDGQTTAIGPEPSTPEESFFDPSTVPAELQGAYKQMQGAWTRKMQELSTSAKANQAKIDAYDQFARDPQGMARQLAQQYGLLTATQQGVAEDEFQPENWSDVQERFYDDFRERFMRELEPVIGKLRQVQQSQIESHLDGKYPDWRNYEKEMITLLDKHPTLASDPDKLYDMAVPSNVKDARYTQAAMRKLEASATGATVSAPSTTQLKPTSEPEVNDFASAVNFAKARLAQGGG